MNTALKQIATLALLAVVIADLRADQTTYRTFIAHPSEVHLFWLNPSGTRFGQLKQLYDFLSEKSVKVEMLMNGGIFEPEGVPSGLCIIDGSTLRPLNTSEGKGNFFLKPNGVFFIDSSGGHVLTTEEYISASPSPRLAIQSGPMLLRAGRIHPAFSSTSTSRLHRNGVGILPDGKILFAITEFGQAHYPTLHEFAEFFRSKGCSSALFLDGDISQMEVNPDSNLKLGNYFGSLIAVFRNEESQ